MSERHAVPFTTSEPLEGLRVVTERMPHVRSVSFGVYVDVGSRDEPDHLAGASHLLEHLLFKGTPARSAREIAEVFDAAGAELNAYTSKEHTCYYARVLDTDLPMAADVVFDMVRNAGLRDEDLEAERKVVLEELHMAADVPEDHVTDVWGEAAIPGHALGRPVIGTLETVGTMSRGDIDTYYRDAYVPGRIVVAAAGNVDHTALVDMVVGAFDGGGPRFRRDGTDATARPAAHTAVYDRRTTEQVHLVWGCAAIGRDDPDRYALAVLNALYGGGMSSRLFQEIREERGLAYSIYSGYQLYVETGLLSVYAGAGEAAAPSVLEIIRAQAADIAGGGAGEDEVERAKGQVRGSLVLSMDDPGGRMGRLARAELVHGGAVTVDELLARVDAVTADDVARVAASVFGSGAVLACLGPAAERAFDFAVEPL